MKKALLAAAILTLTAPLVLAEQPGAVDDNGPHIRKMSEFLFTQMDTNGKGYVTKDEWRAYADKMFDEADTSHDGKVTIDELVNQKLRERDAFKIYLGKNTSDTSTATKDKSN